MAVTDGVGSMNQAEVQDLLKDSRCGVLSLIDDDKPLIKKPLATANIKVDYK
jgi:nitroimidazol reductase NimA-like FMN-containing flavoprotein (pyridoxamine 5'-phosphate oxidase superfamily)